MTTITLTDPRHVDGDPHEVALMAGEQLQCVLDHALEAIGNLHWAARGAWMTSEEHITGRMPKGEEFEETAQARGLTAVREHIIKSHLQASTLTTAASFNPRAPIGKFDE